MKPLTFWIGLVMSFVTAAVWCVIGIAAIVHAYGISVLWWLMGVSLLSYVLMFWPAVAYALTHRKERAAVAAKE